MFFEKGSLQCKACCNSSQVNYINVIFRGIGTEYINIPFVSFVAQITNCSTRAYNQIKLRFAMQVHFSVLLTYTSICMSKTVLSCQMLKWCLGLMRLSTEVSKISSLNQHSSKSFLFVVHTQWFLTFAVPSVNSRIHFLNIVFMCLRSK